MKRYKIVHQTIYEFSVQVQLQPHTLRLRPREGHEQRIESSQLKIVPGASLRWHRDVEGNSVAIATFSELTNNLFIESETVVQKYDLSPQDFLIADSAVDYPFDYADDDRVSLYPYLENQIDANNHILDEWISAVWKPGDATQTFSLLLQLNQRVFQSIGYQLREEEGVQSPQKTLECGTGSCRDLASLFIAVVRRLGFAARFISGYVYTDPSANQPGSTHAWAEVFIPGAGWKGFDPTLGTLVGAEHIAVSVARRPELVPPVAGDFYGLPGASMTVNVWISEFG